MNYNALTQEDKEWLSRVLELSSASGLRNQPKFTKFCDERLLYLFLNNVVLIIKNKLSNNWNSHK